MEGVTFFLAVLMFAQAFADDKNLITLKANSDVDELECNDKWDTLKEPTWKISHHVDASFTDTCKDQKVFVRVRTSANLIEVQPLTLGLIVVSNVVMYVLIGVVVYNLSSQPRAQRTFSGNKASDKQVLIPNGERDTYQPLNPTQKSDYSALGVGKRH